MLEVVALLIAITLTLNLGALKNQIFLISRSGD